MAGLKERLQKKIGKRLRDFEKAESRTSKPKSKPKPKKKRRPTLDELLGTDKPKKRKGATFE